VLIALALLGTAPLFPAAPVHAQAQAPQAQVARVAEQVRRAEAVRDIKRLQASYAQFVAMGLWGEAAALFSSDGAYGEGARRIVGREAITAYLRETIGGGADGVPQGRLYADFVFSPVVTLSPDGNKGKGRWHGFGLDAHYGSTAEWFGSIHENVYVLEDGVWKIQLLQPYPIFAGAYETGWKNVDPVLRAVPYHFNVETLGLPSTHLQDGWTAGQGAAPALADVARRAARLRDESEIQNIQNAYGYYQTRRMWDDVTDLFAPDGIMESGANVAKGGKAIRASLEAVAPIKLKPGELNDTMQFDTVVTIAQDGQSATARGFQFAMIGKANAWGAWTLATFENVYARRDGKWRVAHMRIYPRARTDYAQGWAKSAVAQALLGKGGKAVPARQAAVQYPNAAFPALSFANPVTGQAVAYPAGMTILPLSLGVKAVGGAGVGNGFVSPGLPEVERQLAWASAFDGAENVSNAYGYYIDEFLWRPIGDLFSSRGWKELSYVGTYAGNERVYQSLVRRYGGGGRFVPNMQQHQKVMPVVTPSDDGRSARIHLYLFQLGNGPEARSAAQNAGHYENQAVIENGIWKIEGMDLDYIWRGGYGQGWVKVDAKPANSNAPPLALKTQYPPDAELRGPNEPPWPDMLPLALHFRNPVSGREPELLLPEKHY
jgi:hypothetical protein